MKYTIEGFSQKYAITLRKHSERRGKLIEIKIDCTDLVILRWFVDFYPKMKKHIIDGKEYAWLTHKKLLEDLPIIDISKNAFISRMQKLVDFKILDYKFIKTGGTYSLYTFGENYVNLIDNKEGICSNIYGVYAQTYTGVDVQTHTKDISINNKKLNNNNINQFQVEFEDLWDLYPRKQGKINALKAYIKARQSGVEFDKIKDGINRYCDYCKKADIETNYIKYGSSWFSQECWNDEFTISASKSRKKDSKNFGFEREYTKEELESLFMTIDEIKI